MCNGDRKHNPCELALPVMFSPTRRLHAFDDVGDGHVRCRSLGAVSEETSSFTTNVDTKQRPHQMTRGAWSVSKQNDVTETAGRALT